MLFEVFFPCLLSIIMRSLRIMALFHISASLIYIQFNRRWGFPGSSSGKESACNAGDPSLIPGSERYPGEGTGYPLQYSWASLVAQLVKNHLQYGRPGFNPWVGKIPWKRTWQPTPVFLPGESPWTEEPGGLQSVGSQRVGHNCEIKHRTYSLSQTLSGP